MERQVGEAWLVISDSRHLGGCSSVSCFADTEIFSFICLFGRVSSGEKQQHEVCQTINGDFERVVTLLTFEILVASRIKRFAKYFEILLQLFPRKRLVTVGNKKMIWLLSDSDQHDADLM